VNNKGEFYMCRNIKTLFNFEPPATNGEIREASLQFVRKISGFNKPSKVNEDAFNIAVEEITKCARKLLYSLITNAEPRDREAEAERAHARALERFGTLKH
jgi:hypothetical protein